ncbi:hypothetical protein Bca101_002423 [Brassica carinata]
MILKSEVSVLSPRVAFLDHQRLLLNVDNSALKQRIAALAQDKIFKDTHQESLKREIERLRQVYQQQSFKKMENANHLPETGGSRSARVLSTVVVRALQFRSVVPPSALFSSVPLSLHLLCVPLAKGLKSFIATKENNDAHLSGLDKVQEKKPVWKEKKKARKEVYKNADELPEKN